ncbi:MAG: YceH family protein [Verrucomicrobia bacterium]|nr:YceH family protein [Verrucomicrobiota bacterium]
MNEQSNGDVDSARASFPLLTDVEVRVLGCLIEKSMTTPEHYPLSINALTNACNQKSSRDPVVSYDEDTVVSALDDLREKHLASLVREAHSRVGKYRFTLEQVVKLDPRELSVLCVLMLRGPQTCGELRTRTERMCGFDSIDEVEKVLQTLATGLPFPLAVKLQRERGRKEGRYAHLLEGVVPEMSEPPTIVETEAMLPSDDRISDLERRLEQTQSELADLRKAFEELRKQFE